MLNGLQKKITLVQGAAGSQVTMMHHLFHPLNGL